ncbi:MAG: isocitrate/isopropylmalate family dehydrogenase [Myxococcales bacterium]
MTLENGEKRAVDTQVYTTAEIERIARVAFDLARKRRNKVSSSEKMNVMKTGVLWRQVVSRVGKAEYADVELEHTHVPPAPGTASRRFSRAAPAVVETRL